MMMMMMMMMMMIMIIIIIINHARPFAGTFQRPRDVLKRK